MTSTPTETTLDELLEFIKTARGFDFTGYKRSTLERRIAKGMSEVGAEHYSAYVEQLELNPDEFSNLFNTILINVTGFFRDPATWEYLEREVVPELVQQRPPDAPLRVWCAGVASGEEAYTVAMVLVAVLGEQAFRDRVKIYATDADEEALDQARAAAYPPKAVEDLPREILESYFERSDQRYTFRKDLRRAVIFGRNDLVQDAPISRIDLLVCRNTLMYFNAETQPKILERLPFALAPRGAMFLGKAEMLLTHTRLFEPLDLKQRIFRKVQRPSLRDRLLVAADGDGEAPQVGSLFQLREASFDAGPVAQVVVDSAGLV